MFRWCWKLTMMKISEILPSQKIVLQRRTPSPEPCFFIFHFQMFFCLKNKKKKSKKILFHEIIIVFFIYAKRFFIFVSLLFLYYYSLTTNIIILIWFVSRRLFIFSSRSLSLEYFAFRLFSHRFVFVFVAGPTPKEIPPSSFE